MWYSPPAKRSVMVAKASGPTDLSPTGRISVAERTPGQDVAPNAIPAAYPAKAMAAAAGAGPGTEYWLP
jgi:hypothetical protein